MNSFEFGRININVPSGCPDAAVFQTVVREELASSFGQDSASAAYCKSEYDRCQNTSLPFSADACAASHYQAAQMALSPAAQQWEIFEHGVTDRFSDYSIDDGKAQAPAIPGWRLDQLSAAVRHKTEERALQRDQMKLAPDKGRER